LLGLDENRMEEQQHPYRNQSLHDSRAGSASVSRVHQKILQLGMNRLLLAGDRNRNFTQDRCS
jgi:hypothetical protein